MTRTRLRRRLSAAPWLAAIALALTLLAPAARAQFAFSAPAGAFSGGTIAAHPGDTLTFVGTVTNNYGTELDNVTIAPQFAGGNARYFPSYNTADRRLRLQPEVQNRRQRPQPPADHHHLGQHAARQLRLLLRRQRGRGR